MVSFFHTLYQMLECFSLIQTSMVLRIGATLFSIFTLTQISISKQLLYLLLPIVLILLDEVDNIFKLINPSKTQDCTKTFEYQQLDKWVDAFSYCLSVWVFSLDSLIGGFTLYRILGILLFSLTKSSTWLIVGFDFVKESMLYRYLFGDNLLYLPIAVILKIGFEYYFHTYVNKVSYI